MTSQVFTVAGTSRTAKGVLKARFGNDLVSRIKKLKDNEDLNLVELPRAMTKVEAATYLLDMPMFQNGENRDALHRVIFRNVPKRQIVQVDTKALELNKEDELENV